MKTDLRLLLVDDNPNDRHLVTRELGKEFQSIEVQEPINWEEFKTALQNETFDLVITDYQLLWATGLDILQTVRQQRSHCPVIMFTATGSEEIAVEAMKHGLDDYIIKTYDHLARLRAAVRRALEQAAVAERTESLEQRLANLLTILTVGVFRCRPDGQLLDSNCAFRRLLLIPAETDIRGRNLSEFFLDPVEAGDVAARLQADQQVRNYETRLVREDNTVLWVTLQENMQEEADGTIVIDGIVDDITARKQSEETLRQTEADMAHMARIAAMGELLAGIAHEINQPLNAIANYSVACIKQLESLPLAELAGVREWIGQISEQATRTASIIRGMRQFASRQESHHAPVELHSLLEDTSNLLRFELRKSKAKLQWELAESLPPLVVDRIQIQQVIVNLLQNALESMENVPTERRIITIGTRRCEQGVEVSVADCGAGLGDMRPDQLCQPFVTSKPQGLGMGLPISKTLIQTHGGKLWGENREAGGAVFYFTLPLKREGTE